MRSISNFLKKHYKLLSILFCVLLMLHFMIVVLLRQEYGSHASITVIIKYGLTVIIWSATGIAMVYSFWKYIKTPRYRYTMGADCIACQNNY